MTQAGEERYNVPFEHIKSTRDLTQEVELHATFIVHEVKRRGVLQLTLDKDDALELASTLLQIAALARRKKDVS